MVTEVKESHASAGPGFAGTFVTDDAVVEGSLEFQGDTLVMWAGEAPLLSWQPGQCLLERLTTNRFVLTASGETITFTADDPEALEAAPSYRLFGPEDPETVPDRKAVATVHPLPPAETAAPEVPPPPAEPLPKSDGVRSRPYIKAVKPFEAEPDQEPPPAEESPDGSELDTQPAPPTEPSDEGATIADFAITRARKTRSVRAARWWTREVQTAAIKVAVVSGVVLVVVGFAYGLMLVTGGLDPEAPPTAESGPTNSIVTVPTTTVVTAAPPVTVPLTTSVFELSGSEFAERWNALASDLDDSLLLSPNLEDSFSVVLNANITLDGVLDPATGILRLRAAPTGTPEGDRTILISLALLIGTSEPSLTPAHRGQLLEALGLDPRDPQLGGIDAARTYNGRLFQLVYLTEERVLEFVVTPESAPSTTTTAGS
ncbi:MAG TPA: hypothetical protein VJR05_09750 [Acidimicrobiia bacterium]|nr:hypothetical protein [Acidimicrobiia bacterium]